MTDILHRYPENESYQRHKDAVDRFGKYYVPSGISGRPGLKIDNQTFELDWDFGDEEDPDAQRAWLGWMLCAALANLLAMEAEAG